MKRLWSAVIVALALALIPLPSVAQAELPDYSDREFQELIDLAFEELPSLVPGVGEVFITGDDSVDALIWEIAYDRGYDLQPSATAGDLVLNDGHHMQQLTARAWEDMQEAAQAAGHPMAISSGHRSVAVQRDLFLSRLAGYTTAEINARLSIAAPPGASRHDTGYALDIREVGDPFGDFGATASYEWLAADNYRNAKRFGFVPSYPPSIADAGPDPEPWEWVYVGVDILSTARPFADVALDHFASDSVQWMVDNGYTNGCGELRYCPEDATTRGEIAAFFKRVLEPYLGATEPESFSDTRGHLFEEAIGWLAGHEITLGCDPPSFSSYCPDRQVTRGQMSAMIERAVDHLVEVDPHQVNPDRFVDMGGSVFVDSAAWLAATEITVGCNPPANDEFCPNESVTRAQMAVFLRRIVARL